jgi:WD40 repeat protein
MTQMSAQSHLSATAGVMPARPLRAVPYADPLTGHTGDVGWGTWGVVDDQPVLATGDTDGVVRLWDARSKG